MMVAAISVYCKKKKRWLKTDEIDNLLYDNLDRSKCEWEIYDFEKFRKAVAKTKVMLKKVI